MSECGRRYEEMRDADQMGNWQTRWHTCGKEKGHDGKHECKNDSFVWEENPRGKFEGGYYR